MKELLTIVIDYLPQVYFGSMLIWTGHKERSLKKVIMYGFLFLAFWVK